MTTDPYTRTAPRDPAEESEHELFSTDQRYNPAANNHVVTVTDDSAENWATIRDQVAAGLFGYAPGVHQAYVRGALRSASRGQGRARNR